ncbi:MAG: Ig-like domain-containing protein [Fimbriimonadaceae bacterium]|nr:Ig-like domain-containing protein [Fimbriimonadaceae bacterium]
MKFGLLILLGLVTALGFSAPVGTAECGHAARWKAAFRHGYLPNLLPPKALEAATDTDVLHNTLNISMTPPSTTIAGDNTIAVKSLVNGLTEFTFRLSNSFTMGPVTLDGRTITTTRLDSTTVRANFDRPYGLNETFTLFIPYSGTALSGFFGSIEFGTRSSGAPYCFTLSEPWYAYTWWPNKDDNTDKSTFDLNVTVPNTMKVVGNGLLQGTDSVGLDKLRYRWHSSNPIAPYLVSIAATNFNTWTVNYNHPSGTTPVQFWIWPESDSAGNRSAWEQCVQMMTTYAPLFGQYPFLNEKYGMYQFTFGGGMEHQTCTGMGGFWDSVVAHELAHQWWGDMVTCATWHDIWLNEGFATYTEALWYQYKPGSTGFAAYKSAMNSRRPSSTSGTVYCYDISDPNRIFSGSYSYDKAAWVLHSLRHIVGDTAFFNILQSYRTAYEYRSATTDDFINSCESVYGHDLNWFFDKTVYGTGVPVYQWAWQNTTSNGKSYLLVYVKQTQNATHGVFSMPVDIRPTVGGVKQMKQVFNDGLTENYVIPLTGSATACTFDEDVWILNGGVSSTAFVAGGPTIVETTPAPGATATSPVTSIRLTFHTNVTVSAADFELRNGASPYRIPMRFAYDAPTRTATLTPGKPLRKGMFTLLVKDSIRSVDSNKQLDGELVSNALPSGNGQPGGACSLTFTCNAP